jgi:hypothetical protein
MNPMAAAPLAFYASGIDGCNEAVQHARDGVHARVRARKRSFPVQVAFAASDCMVATLEGAVHGCAGDAIVTGPAGEQWPVARALFMDKYQPIGALDPGVDGTYLSLPAEVLALAMTVPFLVHLLDGRSHLAGEPGDWLVDYGDGSLGVVAPAIFSATYEILEDC